MVWTRRDENSCRRRVSRARVRACVLRALRVAARGGVFVRKERRDFFFPFFPLMRWLELASWRNVDEHGEKLTFSARYGPI